MLRVIRFVLRAIVLLIRVFRWLQRWRRRIAAWLRGKPTASGVHGGTTIVNPTEQAPSRRKVFGSDEGEYVDFVEVKD